MCDSRRPQEESPTLSFVLPRGGALTAFEGGGQDLLDTPCFFLNLSVPWGIIDPHVGIKHCSYAFDSTVTETSAFTLGSFPF